MVAVNEKFEDKIKIRSNSDMKNLHQFKQMLLWMKKCPFKNEKVQSMYANNLSQINSIMFQLVHEQLLAY